MDVVASTLIFTYHSPLFHYHIPHALNLPVKAMKFHLISQLQDTNQLRSSQCSSPLPYLVIHSCGLLVNETPLVLS